MGQRRHSYTTAAPNILNDIPNHRHWLTTSFLAPNRFMWMHLRYIIGLRLFTGFLGEYKEINPTPSNLIIMEVRGAYKYIIYPTVPV